MATITRYPFVRQLTGSGSGYVQLVRNGAVRTEGVAAAFWFRPLGAVISEVPVDDRELPVIFHGRTSDFFDVTVQGTITYRVTDPALAARRVDFSVDLRSGRWQARPLEQLTGLLTETAQQHTVQWLARHPLAGALAGGVDATRDAISNGLSAEPRLVDTGLAVIGVRVVAIRPEPEVEKALQAPAREQVQQEADRAMFERRALAVEREAAIGENELANQIELARREQDLVDQRGRNEQRQAEHQAQTRAVSERASADATLVQAEAQARSVELVGAAEAAAEAARLAAYADLSPAVLVALAAKELAGQLPDLHTLVLSPDTVGAALARFAAGEQA